MKQIWMHKAGSFKEMDSFNREYYLSMSSVERLETMQFLREMYYKIQRPNFHGKGRKRLRRVVKVIQ